MKKKVRSKLVSIALIILLSFALMSFTVGCRRYLGNRFTVNFDNVEAAFNNEGFLVVRSDLAGTRSLNASRVDGLEIEEFWLWQYSSNAMADIGYESAHSDANLSLLDIAVHRNGRFIWYGTANAIGIFNDVIGETNGGGNGGTTVLFNLDFIRETFFSPGYNVLQDNNSLHVSGVNGSFVIERARDLQEANLTWGGVEHREYRARHGLYVWHGNGSLVRKVTALTQRILQVGQDNARLSGAVLENYKIDTSWIDINTLSIREAEQGRLELVAENHLNNLVPVQFVHAVTNAQLTQSQMGLNFTELYVSNIGYIFVTVSITDNRTGRFDSNFFSQSFIISSTLDYTAFSLEKFPNIERASGNAIMVVVEGNEHVYRLSVANITGITPVRLNPNPQISIFDFITDRSGNVVLLTEHIGAVYEFHPLVSGVVFVNSQRVRIKLCENGDVHSIRSDIWYQEEVQRFTGTSWEVPQLQAGRLLLRGFPAAIDSWRTTLIQNNISVTTNAGWWLVSSSMHTTVVTRQADRFALTDDWHGLSINGSTIFGAAGEFIIVQKTDGNIYYAETSQLAGITTSTEIVWESVGVQTGNMAAVLFEGGIPIVLTVSQTTILGDIVYEIFINEWGNLEVRLVE